jgi:hypothetical protein
VAKGFVIKATHRTIGNSVWIALEDIGKTERELFGENVDGLIGLGEELEVVAFTDPEEAERHPFESEEEAIDAMREFPESVNLDWEIVEVHPTRK